MVFSSTEFIFIFLPIFLLIYYITSVPYRNLVLFLGSLFFYAYGEPKFIILLFGSVIFNYFLAKGIDAEKYKEKQNVRKALLALGVCLNISILFVFKVAPAEIGLPLGISFYTFQSISYLADVYMREIVAEKSFIKLGTYISMFPQLVAGPIVNYSEVKAQLDEPKTSVSNFDQGLKDFSIGLVMKVLMADRLSVLWNDIAGIGYISVPVPLLWMGSVSYSMQIYFDFFGYSLMAIGLGKMLGFSLPKNFDLPYMAESIRDFYRKWHITLGRWFAKYVYIPLGGSRNGLKKTIINLFIVWILTSLWHGVGVNFVLWGMLLCLVIVIEKIVMTLQKSKKKDVEKPAVEDRDKKTDDVNLKEIDNSNKLKLNLIIAKVLKHIYVLLVIIISWTCFAISNTKDLGIYLGRMFGVLAGEQVHYQILYSEFMKFGWTLAIGLFICTKPAHLLYQKYKDTIIGNIALVILFWLAIYYLVLMGNNPFMYFRF